MSMDCQDPPLFPDETHFEDMFDDDFDLDAEEPESPCGVTAFDVERASRRKNVAARRAPRLPGLGVDAIDLDAKNARACLSLGKHGASSTFPSPYF